MENTNDIVGVEAMIVARKPWITREMLEELEQRRKLKHQSKERHGKIIDNQTSNCEEQLKTEKGKWWDERCNNLEDLQQWGRYDMVYERIKQLSRKPRKSGGLDIRDKQGIL